MSSAPAVAPESVSTFQGTPTWRIAKGKICRGRESEGNFQTVPQLVGRLVRVGIHSDIAPDNTPYTKIEADLMTSSGLQCVGVKTKYLTSSITFIEGLLLAKKDQLLAIEANQGKTMNQHGSYSTYSNWFLVDENPPHNTTKLRAAEIDKSTSMDVRMERMMEELKKHDAYKERPKKEGAAAQASATGQAYYEQTPSWKIFADEVAAAGKWPTWEEAQTEYLKMCGAVGNATYTIATEVPEAVWGTMRQGHAQSTKVPTILEPVLARRQASAGVFA